MFVTDSTGAFDVAAVAMARSASSVPVTASRESARASHRKPRRSRLRIALWALAGALVITGVLTSGLVSVHAWHRYGGWGFSAGHGCTGIGYIQQPPHADPRDSGWFTDLCQ